MEQTKQNKKRDNDILTKVQVVESVSELTTKPPMNQREHNYLTEMTKRISEITVTR